ncbi:hypothetical protein [Chitinophaga silvatica]|uniref:hypothetical protein n=1 Tax=Chitinophaga silvatica TaxID=2282649 RepID=UPI001314B7E1|nr:hypothetical protein [Chitinophaga silvatica]
MKKKTIKIKSEFSKQEVILTIDEKLNKLKGINPAPELLAEINRSLLKVGNKP